MKYDAILVASGKGERANLGYNKVFYRLKDGKSVLEHAASLFVKDPDCVCIIIVTNEEKRNEVRGIEKSVTVNGGARRMDSVRNGLAEVRSDYVLIHDAARPFLQKEALELLKEKVFATGAAILGHRATDTVKIIQGDRIVQTIDRNTVFLAETPQGFETQRIRACYDSCSGISFTDDASLLESLGHDVFIVEDPYPNPKLTSEEDFRCL